MGRVRPIGGGRSAALLRADRCTGCGACAAVCPVGAITLTDPSLYEGQRTFTRVEAPPPPPPAAPAPASGTPSGVTPTAGTPAPAAAPPKPEDIRPPTPASAAADAQKAAAEKKEQAAGAVMEGKAKTETNITRATPDGVKETGPVTSADEANKKK